MQPAQPSRTALRVALRRAAHQLVDSPLIFEDPLAIAILGPHKEEIKTPERLSSRTLRAFLVARSRYAEDALADAFSRGVRQYVLLGAGLDTFAYRNTLDGLRVFEVDHPATQAGKLELVRGAGISMPPSVVHVPVDFEHQDLSEQLHACGFNSSQPAFFAWLGVVPYLTEPAFTATLNFIASQPPGTGFAMDYSIPPEEMPMLERMAFDSLAARVAMVGEPFKLFFNPAELAQRLHRAGFSQVEDLDREGINARFFTGRSDGFAVLGNGHLLCAWKAASQ